MRAQQRAAAARAWLGSTDTRLRRGRFAWLQSGDSSGSPAASPSLPSPWPRRSETMRSLVALLAVDVVAAQAPPDWVPLLELTIANYVLSRADS